MIKIEIPKYYQVREGQTLREIARAFGVSERVLAKTNGLTEEPFVGQVLTVPKEAVGNAYTACEGQTRALLCGDDERFMRLNGRTACYPGMRVLL